jgi:PKD repeat protein
VNAWLWTFGDPSSGTNNTSTLQNPTHIYNSSGIYNVTLQVTNSTQCTKDTTIQVEVSPRPTAMFEYTAACVGDSTQFTDLSLAPGSMIETYYWDFGCTPPGSCTSGIQNPKFAFPSPGTYNVKLRVTNFAGCSDSITIPVIARPKPLAKFTSVAYFCPAGKVDFQDVSTGSASAIINRLWIFEPGYTSTMPNPSYTFPVTNTNYDVTLKVTDSNGCEDDTIVSVFVKPGFSFSFTNTDVCQGFPTTFTPVNNTPGDTLYSVTWNFGDPSSGPANNSQLYSPTHTFTQPGTFVVKMKAFNSDNCVDSVYREVTVYQAPVPLFGYTSVPCNDTIYFRDSTQVAGSGGIASYLWDFGDPASGPDNTSSSANPLHVYNAEGFYIVKLIVTNNRGCVDSITRTVQKFPCIQAGFDVNDTLCARYSIAFTETSTPVSRINSWKWSWGDGTPDTTYTTYGSPIYHTYSTAGTYPVTLTITSLVNGTTITDNLMGSVTIRPTPVTYFANVPVCLNQFTLFRDTSQVFEENITSWNWNFGSGPGGTSTLRNPPYRYDTAGIYDVKLVVSNKFGCTDSLTKPTRVYGLPVANYESSAACSGDPTFFTDKSMKSDTTLAVWRWSFGDPATLRDTSRLQNPSYIYPDPQEYTIRMIVKDHYGCVDTVDSIVKVNVTPVSAFTVINGYNNKQGQVKMNNVSTGAESYQWEFGNGKYSSEENPVALFTEDGTYTIKLISLNQFDCSDTTYYQYELLFKGLYVPNAFSPSGASLGERLFQPKGINLIQYHVAVFDIWGHLMWESTKLDEYGAPKEGWDGTYKGNLMPQGNYMWKISAVFVDNSQWEGSDIGVGTSTKTMGTVMLIR